MQISAERRDEPSDLLYLAKEVGGPITDGDEAAEAIRGREQSPAQPFRYDRLLPATRQPSRGWAVFLELVEARFEAPESARFWPLEDDRLFGRAGSKSS